MILNIICFKNMVIEAFTQPQFVDIEPEKAAVQLARSIKLEKDPTKIKTYENLVMFKLGTFDDESGVIVPDNILLVDLRPLVAAKLAEFETKDKEVALNGVD